MTTRDRTAPDVVRRLAAEADALDHAVYDAVAEHTDPDARRACEVALEGR